MNRETILIAEDDEELLEIIRIRLEGAGFHVVGVANGEEALSLAQTKLPNLIVLDVFLPDMDGLTILKRLKSPLDIASGEPSKTKDIPVIVITGKAPMIENMTRLEGAADFYVKPVDLAKLVERITQLIALRQKDESARL